MKDRDVLEVIRTNPGFSGYQIHNELVKRSRTGRWFGEHAFLTALLGPNFGSLYVCLARLETNGEVTAIQGIATPERGGHRPMHYYAKEA